MITKSEAEQRVLEYMADPEGITGAARLGTAIDAFSVLGYPVPQSLCSEFAAAIQKDLPPGFTAIAEPYLGRVRILVVKNKALRQWMNRPKDQHD
jgi:hypothetical protein